MKQLDTTYSLADVVYARDMAGESSPIRDICPNRAWMPAQYDRRNSQTFPNEGRRGALGTSSKPCR